MKQTLPNPSGDSLDYYGYQVAIDGGTLAVSAPMGFQGGTLYIYQLKNDVWTLENSFQAEDSNSYDQLGISLDLQGDILVAGAPGDNEKGPNMGSAYIFRNGATGWSTEAKVFNQSLSSTDKFGLSVALDNGVLAVGAPMEYYNGAGAAVLFFNEDAGTWTFDSKIQQANSAGGNLFGFGMDLDGDTFVAGTPYKTGWFGGSGNAVVFRKVNGIWTESETLPGLPNDANNTDDFGSIVRVNNGRIIVGAPQYDETVSGYGGAGAVVVYDEVNGVYTQTKC